MKRKTLVTLLTVLLLVAIALPVGAQTIWQTYGNVRAKQLNVLGATDLDGTLNVDGASTLAAVGAAAVTATGLTVNGSATATGVITTGTFLVLSPATNLALTESSTITPTGSYQGLTAAYAVGTSSIATKPAGTLLRLVNLGTNAITITDTGTISLSGNIALGQYDSLLLMSDGAGWVMMGTSNN